MAANRLYPELDERERDKRIPESVTESRLDELTEGKLSKSRASEIINKRKEFEKELKHYKKVRRKYKTASNVLRGLGIGLGGALALTGAVTGGLFTAGIAIPVLVPTILAGVGAFEATLSGTIAFTYIKRRIHRFSEKYDLVNTYLNRLYHLYHRSIEDARITVDEMDEFHKLVRDYESEMSKLNSGDSTDPHVVKLSHKAEAEVRKEVEEEMIAKLKEERKRELMKTFRNSENGASN